MMNPSEAAYELARESEGLKLRAYLCPAGKWTIGFGHTGPEVVRGLQWSKWQADASLKADMAEAARKTNRLLGALTTQSRFDALVDFVFNLGSMALANSTLLRKHLAGDFEGAAAEFGRWNKAHVNGVLIPLKGLTERRAAEAALYRAAANH